MIPLRRTSYIRRNLSQNRQKKYVYTIKRNVNQIKEIPSENEKIGHKRYLTRIMIALLMIACLIIIGVIIALIVVFTRKSPSNTSTNVSTTAASTTWSSPTINDTTSSASISTPVYGFSVNGTIILGMNGWYDYEEEVIINCSVDLINITIIITVQKMMNATYSDAFSTFWTGTINQSYVDNETQVIYKWTIMTGQIIQTSGSPYRVQIQISLHNTNETSNIDTYHVTGTTVDGITNTFSGHF